ncbi:MAG TPA: EamA family transporter, partial [Stenotrophomonas sp.]|nr:EamA family transporter [Stenotrophomonas sp.]
MSAVQGNGGRRLWLFYALAVVALWGVWGSLSSLSAEHGFPDTLVYCVWALTMIPPALFVLWRGGWQLDRTPRAMFYGLLIGLLGAGGQMLLFRTLTLGPAYFIFPIISLSPVITIVLSFLLLRERTGKLGALGIVLALLSLPLLDLSFGGGAQGLGWFALSLLIMLA